MLNKKTRYLNRGFSPHLRKGWREMLVKDRKKIIARANAIIEQMIEDADNGKLVVTHGGQQTTVIKQPFIFMRESDEIEYQKEPTKKIIWNTVLTGIPNQ